MSKLLPDSPPTPAWRIAEIAAGALFALTLAAVAWSQAALPPADAGLTARYFPQPGFRGVAVTRIDPGFGHWADRSPLRNPPEKGLSVRWRGCLITDRPTWLVATGTSSFFVKVDGDKVIDRPDHGGERAMRAAAPIPAGNHPIWIDYNHRSGPAAFALQAADSAGGRVHDLDVDQLVPRGGNDRHPCAVPR